MTNIQKFIDENAIVRSGVRLFTKTQAIAFTDECRKSNVRILGIDLFYILSDGRIQPSMEHSVDFSSKFYKPKIENVFDNAREFLNSKDDDAYFEITIKE